MTPRRIAALLAFAVAAGLLWVALLTPLRSAEVAERDAEAQRLAEQWDAYTEDLLGPDEESQRLLRASNDAYAAARDLEPPLAPVTAIGAALIALAGGVALWPAAAPETDAPAPSA